MNIVDLFFEIQEKRDVAEHKIDAILKILDSLGPRASPFYDRLDWHLDEVVHSIKNLADEIDTRDTVAEIVSARGQ